MTVGPEVLVVLPTLGDRLDTLAETLASIEAQRSDVALTLAVVLPDSATEAARLARDAGAIVVLDPREGISEAINRGVAARTTETWYAWMGDDDLFRPGGLATLLGLVRDRPDAVVAYGGCDYIDGEGRVLFTSAAGKSAQWLLPWGPDLIPHPGSIIRLDDLEAIGAYSRQWKFALDLDVFLRLRRRGAFLHTRRTVSAFRWHADSLTVSDRSGSSREAEAVKRAALPRWAQPLSILWLRPVTWAAAVAAAQLSKRTARE